MEFEVRSSDPDVNAATRSEVKIPRLSGISGGIGDERWFGFSVKPPADWPVVQDHYSVVHQWHAYPDDGEPWRPPPLQINIHGAAWRVIARSDGNRLTNGTIQQERVWEAPIDFGEWSDWVVHVKWEYDGTGLLEVWHNGVKVVERRGPIGFNDASPVYFKTGLYISRWINGATGSRTIIFDDLKVAGPGGSYDAVAPGR